jgi:hypothetical protein
MLERFNRLAQITAAERRLVLAAVVAVAVVKALLMMPVVSLGKYLNAILANTSTL